MNSPRKKTNPSFAQRAAVRPYDRLEQLPKLIGLWPSEMQDFSAPGTAKILALLRKALRSERARGRAGHWTYDLNRHLVLAESLKAERAHLRELGAAPVAAAKRAARTGPAARAEKILSLPGLAAERGRGGKPGLATPRALPCPGQPVFLVPSLAESSS